MLPLPPMILRWLRLVEARRALLDGSPERTLALLRDPLLSLSSRADLLRGRALDVLYRSAADRRAQGRDGSVARILALIAGEDPDRARRARDELQARTAPANGPTSRLGGLVARMRAEHARKPAPPPSARTRSTTRAARPATDAQVDPRVRRFHLAVDDGGEFLVLAGPRLAIGHARAGKADLSLLADLESEHAQLFLGGSLHDGPTWSIAPIGARSLRVRGVEIGPEGTALMDGDELELASNARLRFTLPERASGTALIELLRGLESEGATRVLCFAPGAAGRVRIGPHANRHIPIAGLEHEVALLVDAQAITLSCAGGVRSIASEAPAAEVELRIALPLRERIDLAVNARPSQRLPFGITLRPLDEPPPEFGLR